MSLADTLVCLVIDYAWAGVAWAARAMGPSMGWGGWRRDGLVEPGCRAYVRFARSGLCGLGPSWATHFALMTESCERATNTF